MDMRALAITATLVTLVSAPTATSQEWARFRGPNGQGIGVAPDLPAKLASENVLWRVAVGGKGHSSPVLWGERLYLTRDRRKGAGGAKPGAKPGAKAKPKAGGAGTRDLVCFDAATGKELWSAPCAYESYRQHQLNSFASATPVVDAAGIYLYWTSGDRLVAVSFDHAGKRRWRRELGGFAAQHGSGASPILHAGMVIVANEHEGEGCFLTALDCATGEPRWKIPRRTAAQRGAYATPLVHRPAQGDAYLLFASTAHGLTAVDPADGKVLWELDVGFKQRCVNVPVVLGDLLFFSAGSGGAGQECAFVRLPAAPEHKPEIVRRLRRAIPYVPGGLALDGHFYLFTDGGVASCIAADSGKVAWRERLGGTFFSSPVSNGKTIYIADRAGKLHTLAPGETFSVLSAFDLGKGVFATPAIAHGRLYVRTFDELLCFGPAPDRAGAPERGPAPPPQHPRQRRSGEKN